jgi:hypothetical protein
MNIKFTTLDSPKSHRSQSLFRRHTSTVHFILMIGMSRRIPRCVILRACNRSGWSTSFTHQTYVHEQFYFRYEGSTLEPPCIETTHWRVLSNPIKVSPSQLRALHYLLKQRIDPDTCEYDTAAYRQSADADEVKVNRPIQARSENHRLVYCECSDWEPKGDMDRALCELPRRERGVLEYEGVPAKL